MGNLKKLPTAKNGDNFKVYLSFLIFFKNINTSFLTHVPLSLFFAGGWYTRKLIYKEKGIRPLRFTKTEFVVVCHPVKWFVAAVLAA